MPSPPQVQTYHDVVGPAVIYLLLEVVVNIRLPLKETIKIFDKLIVSLLHQIVRQRTIILEYVFPQWERNIHPNSPGYVFPSFLRASQQQQCVR